MRWGGGAKVVEMLTGSKRNTVYIEISFMKLICPWTSCLALEMLAYIPEEIGSSFDSL